MPDKPVSNLTEVVTLQVGDMAYVVRGGNSRRIDLGTAVVGQASDADLTAIAALIGTGIPARTADDTWALRTLTAPEAGISITNPAGVGGNPTLVLTHDLAALEALPVSGLASRTGESTWATRVMQAPAAGLTIANGGGSAGNPTFALANDLAALEALSTSGFAERTGVDTWQITGFTGTGDVVRAQSPTLVTPVLGTPSSGTLTSCTGLPVASGVSGLGTGVATALAVNVGSAGALVANGAALGTPSSGTLTNCSGLPTSGVSGLFGKQSVWVPAAAMTSRSTNGAPPAFIEMATNKNMVATLDFDAATQEFAQFDIRMPKSWNEGTVTFIPVWSHPATTTNFGVVWGLDAVAISNDDAMDVAFGTEQTSVDTGGTTNDSYQGPESAAITIAGTPAAGDLVQYRMHRNVADGSDTMAVDARLHGVLLLYTIDASIDD